MSGENCSILNCRTSRAALGVSFFRIPKKNDDYITNWKENIVTFIACDKVGNRWQMINCELLTKKFANTLR